MKAIKRAYSTSGGSVDMEGMQELYFGSIEERNALANAINNKGVPTNVTDSLTDMAEHVTHIYEGGNAVAAQITQGYSAWVDGVLVQGTRPPKATGQSGSFTLSVGRSETYTKAITFSQPFDTIPTVNVTYQSGATSCTKSGITQTGFLLSGKNAATQASDTLKVSWTATAT